MDFSKNQTFFWDEEMFPYAHIWLNTGILDIFEVFGFFRKLGDPHRPPQRGQIDSRSNFFTPLNFIIFPKTVIFSEKVCFVDSIYTPGSFSERN